MDKNLCVLLLFLSLSPGQAQQPSANPFLQPYGQGIKIPSQAVFETGCNAPTYVFVGNSGPVQADDVEVVLSESGWGITFGEWAEVARTVISVGAEANETVRFDATITTEDRGHHCLQARIVGGDGGNSNSDDDIAQSSNEVLFARDQDAYVIPFRRGDGTSEDAVVDIKFGCVLDDGSVETTAVSSGKAHSMYCGDVEVLFEMPDVDDTGKADLPSGAEIYGKVSVDFGALVMTASGNANNGEGWQYSDRPSILAASASQQVIVQAKDKATGEESHVMLHFLHASVSSLLNVPHLCELASIKSRVVLESELGAALEAYEAEQYESAIAHIERYMDKAALLRCELSCNEQAALDASMLAVGDASRMIAQEHFLGPATVVQAAIVESDHDRRARYHRARVARHRRLIRRH